MRKLIMQYAKDLTAGRLASGFEHASRVYHLAREIGEETPYDDDVLYAACFLHNVEAPAANAEAAAEKAAVILSETGFTVEKIGVVLEAIRQHSPGSSPQGVEAQLLYDANLLDTIGAVGVVRLSIGAFFWNHYKTMEQVLNFLRQRLQFTQSFHFERSRSMAATKVDFLRSFIQQFEAELKL